MPAKSAKQNPTHSHLTSSNKPTAGKVIEQAQKCVTGDLSHSPRAEAVVQCVSSMVDPDTPLEFQHDIKLFWHPQNLSFVLSGKPFDAKPITMELDATLDCNYACPFCTYLSWERRTEALAGTRYMGRTEMELILNRVVEGGVKGIIFTGGGEPFLNPHTPFGLEKAAQLGIRTGIFTNGSLLTPELIDRVLATEPQFLRISANAVTPSVYTAFHGIKDERFAQGVWNSIRYLAFRIGTAKTSFGLGVVVNRINCDDLLPLIENTLRIVADGGRIDYIAVRPVVNYGGPKQISAAVVEKVRRAREISEPMIEGSGLKLFFSMEYFNEVAAAGERETPAPTSTHCEGHPWMASIAYSGDVYLCSEGKGDPRNRLGNLIEQTLDDIWTSALRGRVICSSCNRPPVCKAHRLTTRITRLMDCGPLTSGEIALVERFLNELRAAGEPGGVEFL